VLRFELLSMWWLDASTMDSRLPISQVARISLDGLFLWSQSDKYDDSGGLPRVGHVVDPRRGSSRDVTGAGLRSPVPAGERAGHP
jgi:hypothetical protein